MFADIKYRIISFLNTFVSTFFTIVAIEAMTEINIILSGNYSEVAILSLLTALLRTALKAVLMIINDRFKKPIEQDEL
jgi:hypothetical protein